MKIQSSKLKIQNFYFAFCIFKVSLLIASCGSIPNLETPECAASRNSIKEFYSFHFGDEMRFSPENLREREKFLTPEFIKILQNVNTENDVFTTNNTDFPKAFRVGKCERVSTEKNILEIVLFWSDDTRREEKKIKVEAVKQGDKWLINKVFN